MSKNNKVDVLAFGAHPDDVEACAAGLLLVTKRSGLKTGIVDLTRGELSNFGSMVERDTEAIQAAKLLNLDARENLNIPDGHVTDTQENLLKVVNAIRKYRPETVLLPYFNDTHPDHATAGILGKKAVFFSKVKNYHATNLGPHQVQKVMFYMLHTEFPPSFVLDISDVYKTREKSLFLHKSQFYVMKNKKYTKEFINSEFMEFLENRAKVYGYKIGVKYGEPFLIEEYLGLKNLDGILSGKLRSLTPWKTKK